MAAGLGAAKKFLVLEKPVAPNQSSGWHRALFLIVDIALLALLAALLCYGGQLVAWWSRFHVPIRYWHEIVGKAAFLAPGAGQDILVGGGVGLLAGVLFPRHVILVSVALGLVQGAFYLNWLLSFEMPAALWVRTSAHIATCLLGLLGGALIGSRLCRQYGGISQA